VKKIKLVGSIVTYNNNFIRVTETAKSFLSNNSVDSHLIVYDNCSSNGLIDKLKSNFKAHFIEGKNNYGFGRGHNQVLKLAPPSEYFLVLNPDITITPGAIEKMVAYMDEYKDIGLMGAKIINPDGSLQFSCRRRPSFFLLFARRFLPKWALKIKAIENLIKDYEMRDTQYNKILSSIPFLSGCFMLFRRDVLEKVGGFDEKFFLYFEDADITHRVNQVSQTIFFPEAEVIHDWARGNHQNFKLTLIMIKSAFYYFKKWGWKFV
jgi:GT2 family glycosyltransferase